jgi:pimeloyl-ACP methyl ester carboxylesterase
VVPAGGHVALLEQADEVNEAIDQFLRKVTT